MFVIRPWFSHPMFLLALLAASLLFPLAGQRACASTLSGSWYLTETNSSSYPSGSNYAEVTVSVDSSDKATFNVNLLSALPNNYFIDKFAFNWGDSSNIKSQLSTAIDNAGSPLNNWSVSGSSKEVGGMGKYGYQIDAHGNNNRVNPLSFTMDLSGLGLSQSDIFNDFQVASSGGNGGGYFALHAADGSGNTFYLSGTEPVANPEPNSIISMGIAAALLLCFFCGRSVLRFQNASV